MNVEVKAAFFFRLHSTGKTKTYLCFIPPDEADVHTRCFICACEPCVLTFKWMFLVFVPCSELWSAWDVFKYAS